MKICMLNVLHAHDDKRVFQKIARSLVQAGHEIVSIVPGPAPREAQGIRFLAYPVAHSKMQRFLAIFRLVQLGRAERAGVYYAPESESWVAALIIKALTGARVVFDEHEHVPTELSKFFPRVSRPVIEWLTVRFMRLFARYTDLIILTRESFRDQWHGLRTPLVTIINTNHLQPVCAEIPAELQARFAGRPTVIHQGIFGDIRGSWQLLGAVKLLAQEMPDIRCIVLGPYVYGSEDDYRAAIVEAGLEDHLLLLGTVPYEEVPAYIALAQAGLILFQPGPLNHTLAMPHKLFDYMREARPTVAPAFALEVRHIIQESDCGLLIDVTQPRAIADAILSLLRNPAEAQRLGENGRSAVEERYNWQREERILLDAFAALESPR